MVETGDVTDPFKHTKPSAASQRGSEPVVVRSSKTAAAHANLCVRLFACCVRAGWAAASLDRLPGLKALQKSLFLNHCLLLHRENRTESDLGVVVQSHVGVMHACRWNIEEAFFQHACHGEMHNFHIKSVEIFHQCWQNSILSQWVVLFAAGGRLNVGSSVLWLKIRSKNAR